MVTAIVTGGSNSSTPALSATPSSPIWIMLVWGGSPNALRISCTTPSTMNDHVPSGCSILVTSG